MAKELMSVLTADARRFRLVFRRRESHTKPRCLASAVVEIELTFDAM